MSHTDAAIIDAEDQTPTEPQLQFQDFSGTYGQDRSNYRQKEQLHTFTDFPDDAVSDDDGDAATENADLLQSKSGSGDASSQSFFSFAYYQKYFDVETNQVLSRILWSMIPRRSSNYLESHIRPNPDLYGPFWICATLVFAVGISGNLASYLANAGKDDFHSKYDFHKVSIAATVVYTYASIVPLSLWLILWYRKNDAKYTLLEILCIYGYSLAIYIPVSVLWTIPIEAMRWSLVFAGSTLSGSVLLSAIWPAFHNETKKLSIIVMSLLFVLHLLLAVGFVMYFFRSSHDTHDASRSNATTAVHAVTQILNVTSTTTATHSNGTASS
ncbi:Yip1 member 1 [Chamberlinius hualienensis]